jgi:hypothetical protein
MTQTPDGVPCRHCGKPIFWDEICWVHSNGFSDCGLVITGGKRIGTQVVLDPSFIPTNDPNLKDKRALPHDPWS